MENIVKVKKKTALHEIIAVEDSKKQTAEKLWVESADQFKNHRDRYEGFHRRYAAHADDGEKLPPEEKNLEDSVMNKLDWVFGGEIDFVDVALTKETTNQHTRADVIINGTTVIEGIPATGLLFLEKRIKRWLEVINALPTLDPAEQWELDENTGSYVSKERSTVREKKELRWKIITDATKEHKAQYETWTETIPVGDWIRKRFSGAVTVKMKAEIIKRVKTLYEAVVAARMRANMQEIESRKIGKDLYKYIIGQS